MRRSSTISPFAAECFPPGDHGSQKGRIWCIRLEAKHDTSTSYFVVENGHPRLIHWETENPTWVERAIVYGVVPHNVGPSGFRSVIDKLDDLQDLGINAIWLCPITQTPSPGHGYGVSDYFEVRADYGTKADFQDIVWQAHAHGIRVLMDFVPNHSSDHHPYFLDAQAQGSASPYYSFYDRDEKGDYTYYFHWQHLPNLNYNNPEVETWMIEAFSYWVREFDIDGFRVDAAWGIKQRKPEFWPRWRRELQRIKPDLLLLAEASARDPYYFDNGFDAAYDWTDQLGHWAMEHVFEDEEGLEKRLRDALTNEGGGFHPDALVFRFLNNNDTGARFHTRYGLDMARVAAAMLLTLPGIPCIYTGEEVGAEFEPYKTPGPIPWEDTHGLREYYRKLIALRHRLPGLRSRQWILLDTASTPGVCAYLRFQTGAKPVLVVLNFSSTARQTPITLPIQERDLVVEGVLRDVLADEVLPIADTNSVTMPLAPWSARILTPGQ